MKNLYEKPTSESLTLLMEKTILSNERIGNEDKSGTFHSSKLDYYDENE
jgi:hypothetical protein